MTGAPSRFVRMQARAARTGWARAEWNRFDTALVGVAAIATALVHPVQRMLAAPYWVDEAWVAVLTRAPLGRLVRLSSSTPAGFVFLLRLVPGAGLQRQRLVVLLFSVLTVVVAYGLTRSLPWRSRGSARLTAIVAALAVMLAPFSLMRNDLKQYTCDGFCALLLLAVGSWADREQRRSRLCWLVGATVVVAPFSSTSAFVSIAVFAGLLGSALLARSGRRVVDVLALGGVAAAGVAAYYAAAVVPNLNSRLRTYWSSRYLSGSPFHMLSISWRRLSALSGDLAMPAIVFVAFFVLGIWVLLRIRARALAIAVPFLWIEMMVVARVKRYPFLDLRTSHFLLVSSFVIVAIGAVGLVQAIAQFRPARFATATTGAAVVLGVAIPALFAVGFVPHLHELNIPNENVRAEVQTVAAHRHPNDVIVVNDPGKFGFAYYWPHGPVIFRASSGAQGFRSEAPDAHAIYAGGRSSPKVLAAMREGVERWRRAGVSSVLFIVRTHLSTAEDRAFHRALRVLHVRARQYHVGTDALWVVFHRHPRQG